MFARTALAVALTCACMTSTGHAFAGKGGRAQNNDDGGIAGVGIPPLTTTRVASGLVRPIYATYAPGDATRLFIIEKQGLIRILKIDVNPPVLLATPFLNIDAIITGGTSTSSEQGLLGLVFHPDYATNGYFWVYYTAQAPLGNNTVARFQRTTADVANPTPTVLHSLSDPFTNHNGGWMGFKPGDTQGYLYICSGDSGSANDPNANAQNINVLFGKMLRIDIDGADGIPGNDDDDGDVDGSTGGYTSPPTNPFFGGIPGSDEIWDYGLRNPWRASFDRGTGDLYIADVGQDVQEEVNFEPSNSTGGRNYGWRCMEGTLCTGLTGCVCQATCVSNGLICPIHTYNHGGTPFKCSITGGYVYRGSAIPALQGTYFFADYNCGLPGNAPIFSFTYTGGVVTNFVDRTVELVPAGGLTVDSITSFGEDLAGEIYICDQDGGEVFKIIPAPPTNDTCAGTQTISAGTTAFSTVSATTQGPDESAGCGVGEVYNDVWYRFQASCTGTATVSLCGASFDTRLAAYGAICPAGAGETIACNDDACGSSSEVSFPVVSGTFYRLRVGAAVAGVTGTGSLVLSCVVPPACPSDIDETGTTDIDDLLFVISAWGTGAGPADVDNDNDVDIDDLLAVIGGWGPCD